MAAPPDLTPILQIVWAQKSQPAGWLFCQTVLITLLEQQPKQQPMQPKQQRKQPKQRSKQQQLRRLQQQLRSKRQQQRQRLEQQQEQQEQQLLEQLQVLVLLLFSSKQPEQQPAGTRSAGIFSLVFLS